MEKIHFVTTNKEKFQEVKSRLSKLNIELIQVELDMEEKRTFDILEIAKHKLDQAKTALPDKKIIVDDRGFFIESLEGFPGAFVKLLLGSIKIDGLIRLMQPFENRNAKFTTAIGYFDGAQDHFFKFDEEGFITNTVRSGNLRGWTEILYVYGYKDFPNRALCELSDAEWNVYMNKLAEHDHIDEFINFYKSNKAE